jgi:carbonic anhydrase
MGEWLEQARDSLTAYRDHHPARASAESNDFGELDQLAIVNVAVQVERLARHQILAPAVASGAVRVVGMFFDLSTVHVYEVDQNGLVCVS